MDAKLIEMARRSPKAYAATIRDRNTQLLEKLNLLVPYIDYTLTSIPDAVAKRVMEKVPLGCPHCQAAVALRQKHEVACDFCLWRAVMGDKKSCMQAAFTYAGCEPVTLMNMNEFGRSVAVQYTCEFAWLNLCSFAGDFLKRVRFDDCVCFLKAHIEWAELDCWGADYKEPT